MDPASRVREVIEADLVSGGFELVDVEVAGRVLRVTVDRPEGALDLDAVSRASQVVSELLDRHDPMPGAAYTLEVSSPGVERRLRTPEHFRRHVGSTVAVRTLPEVAGERRFEGPLEVAGEDGITVAAPGGRRTVRYDEIDRAHTVFVWGPAPKPGRAAAQKKKASTA